MKTNRVQAGMIVYGALLLAPVLLAQGGRGPGGRGGILAHSPANDNKPYDKHDLSGIWSRNGTPGGYGGGGTCRDCGDRGFGNDVPPFTPLGQKMFDANKPSYGRLLGSADAAAHPEKYEAKIFGEKDGGGTQVLYLAPKGLSFQQLGLPKLSEESPAHFSESVSHAPYLHGFTPIALYATAAFLIRRNKKKEEEAERHEEGK